MSIQQARFEFAPPPTPGLVRAVGLAILAHGLLLAMLAAGVQWKHQAAPVTAEAELWSAIPQEAAPPLPLPEPEPAPLSPERAAPEPVVAPEPDPSIAIAQEKARLEKEREKQQRLEKLAQDKRKQERLEDEKRLKEKQKKEKLQKEQEARDKAMRDKAAADKAKQQEAKAAAADAKKLADLREQNLKRMAGLAAGTGGPNATGSAAQASGPSAGYGGRIRARIKPNITFTDTPTDNPVAEVEVRTSPDGTIISRKLTKSSGLKSWDDAVLNAIDKTEVLPKDVDGRVPTSLIISFRPRD
jgi:colicin import membrane protein